MQLKESYRTESPTATQPAPRFEAWCVVERVTEEGSVGLEPIFGGRYHSLTAAWCAADVLAAAHGGEPHVPLPDKSGDDYPRPGGPMPTGAAAVDARALSAA